MLLIKKDRENLMEIEKIYPPYIYSVRYDHKEENEYDSLFSQWYDLDYLGNFFQSNNRWLIMDIWRNINTLELASRQVIDEADEMDSTLFRLYENTVKGIKPDYDSHFYDFGGKYQYVMEYCPVKSYGYKTPSLLRIYAIKMESNTYLVTGGGIKLGKSIQDSPGLSHIITDIENVRNWLKKNGIIDKNDINKY